jgi:hypothetical protein
MTFQHLQQQNVCFLPLDSFFSLMLLEESEKKKNEVDFFLLSINELFNKYDLLDLKV